MMGIVIGMGLGMGLPGLGDVHEDWTYYTYMNDGHGVGYGARHGDGHGTGRRA